MKFGKEIQDFIKKNQQYIAPIRYLDYKRLKKIIKDLKKVKKDEDAAHNKALREQFISECELELAKIIKYSQMERKLLSDKAAMIPKDAPLDDDIDTTIRDVCAEYRAFIDYLEINIEAYRKIGKKWDKNYGNDVLQAQLKAQAEQALNETITEAKANATDLFSRGGSITESLNDKGQVAKDIREMWSFAVPK